MQMDALVHSVGSYIVIHYTPSGTVEKLNLLGLDLVT
jgi:hypothetical protein